MVPDNEDKIVQIFQCPTCDKDVEYKREIVMGLVSTYGNADSDEEKVVYLTCPDGHTHRYTVSGG